MSTDFRIAVRDDIAAQVAFWRDPARVRGFVGGVGSGKTFAGAIAALTAPAGSVGMIVAPDYPTMSRVTMRTFFELCPPQLIKEKSAGERWVRLVDGKVIFWASAHNPESLRGPNLGWWWGDEWAYVDEEAHRVLMGRLRKRPGRCWWTTTPNGQNWLYDWAVQRDLGYSVHHAHTRDNPYNLDSFAADLEREYASDPLYIAQELAGQWVDLSGSKRFPGTLVEACFAPRERLPHQELPAIQGIGNALTYTLPDTVRVYAEPVEGREYRLGLDCAEGVRGGDDSAIVVNDRATGAVVAVGAGEWEPKEEHAAYAAILSRWYNGAAALPERNNHGHAVIGALERFNVPVLEGLDGRPGWATSATSKAQMCATALQTLKTTDADNRALEGGEPVVIFPDAKLKEQVKGIDRLTLRGPGKGRVTKVDDLFIAWALADVARSISEYEDIVMFF